MRKVAWVLIVAVVVLGTTLQAPVGAGAGSTLKGNGDCIRVGGEGVISIGCDGMSKAQSASSDGMSFELLMMA